jgi:hypothetical protein
LRSIPSDGSLRAAVGPHGMDYLTTGRRSQPARTDRAFGASGRAVMPIDRSGEWAGAREKEQCPDNSGQWLESPIQRLESCDSTSRLSFHLRASVRRLKHPPGLLLVLCRLNRLSCRRILFAAERLSPSTRERLLTSIKSSSPRLTHDVDTRQCLFGNNLATGLAISAQCR